MNIEWLWTDVGGQMWCIGLAALIFDVIAILAMVALIVWLIVALYVWLMESMFSTTFSTTRKVPKPEVSPEEIRAYRRTRGYED